jgi:hypothetical protein
MCWGVIAGKSSKAFKGMHPTKSMLLLLPI